MISRVLKITFATHDPAFPKSRNLHMPGLWWKYRRTNLHLCTIRIIHVVGPDLHSVADPVRWTLLQRARIRAHVRHHRGRRRVSQVFGGRVQEQPQARGARTAEQPARGVWGRRQVAFLPQEMGPHKGASNSTGNGHDFHPNWKS